MLLERIFDKDGVTERVSLPHDASFTHRSETHHHASHQEALEAYLQAIDALLAEGYFERPPTLHLVGPAGEPSIDVQLPSFNGYAFSSGEHVGPCSRDGFCAVLRAFQVTLKHYLAKGFVWEPMPCWPGAFAKPDAAQYVEVDAVNGQTHHHFFHHKEDPKNEFGPEWRSGGEIETYGYQIATTAQGVNVSYCNGRIAQVQSYHRGEELGSFLFLFNNDGSLVQVKAITKEGTFSVLATWSSDTFAFNTNGDTSFYELEPNGRRLKRVVYHDAEMNRVVYYYPDGETPREEGFCTNDGARVGTWRTLNEDGSVQTPDLPPGDGLKGDEADVRKQSATLDTQQILTALFRCLEEDTFLATPPAGVTFAPIGFAEGNDAALETHLARIYMLATYDEEQSLLKHHVDAGTLPERTLFPVDHAGKKVILKSAVGSKLDIGFKKGRVSAVTLKRADGSIGATLERDVESSEDNLGVTVSSQGRTRAGQFRVWRPGLTHVELWVEHDRLGRLSRAYDTNRNTDFLYDDAFYENAIAPNPDAYASSARECEQLASGVPSREAFKELCNKLVDAASYDLGRCRTELIPQLLARVTMWPSTLRAAPLLWINRLTMRQLPIEALSLVSALSLTAAACMDYWKNPHYALLLDWLARYPAEGPALEGVTCSFTKDAKLALLAACNVEPNKRLCPVVSPYDWVYSWRTDALERGLASPLFRKARIVDLSHDPVDDGFEPDSSNAHKEEFLAGRGLNFSQVLRAIPSTEMEVLNLHGTITNWDTRSAGSYPKWPNLRVLNIGGARSIAGHPSKLKAIKKAFPTLTALDTSACVAFEEDESIATDEERPDSALSAWSSYFEA